MSNIILWYDNEKYNNCFDGTDLTYPTNTIREKLKRLNIDYQIKLTSTGALLKHDKNFFIIEVQNVFKEHNIFATLSKHTKKLLSSKELNLVIWYPREGHEIDWINSFYQSLKQNDLLSANVYLVYGDYDVEDNYKEFISNSNIPSFLTPLYIDYFKSDLIETSTASNTLMPKGKPLDFLFYNGKMRPHRAFAVAELTHRNLLKNGLVSLLGATYTGESYTIEDIKKMCDNVDIDIPKHIYNFLDNWQPMILDKKPSDLDMKNLNQLNYEHYLKTYFSIVSETNMRYRFITEKTYKPIYNLHPFIILGAPHTLKLLKEMGYKTFPELFNESYDSEIDPHKRFLMVIDEVEKFCNLSLKEKREIFSSVTEKLLYNKLHYIESHNKNSKNDFLKLFGAIHES